MASAERFEVYPATFVHSGGTLTLSQIQDFRASTGAQKSEVIPAGVIDRQAVIVANANPSASVGTRDLNTYFGTVSATLGLCLSGNAVFQLQEREECAAFVTGSTHGNVTATGGVLKPDTISVDNDSVDGAVLRSTFFPFWDGTNKPFVFNDAAALSGTPAFNSQYYMGGVYSGGDALANEIDGVSSMTFDFGLNFVLVRASGAPYPTSAYISSRQPVFTFRTGKTDEGASVDMFGRAVSTAFAFYFRKGTNNGDRVPKSTAQHCKISCTAGDIETNEVGGTAGQDAELVTTVRPTGTITLSVASAMPTA